MEGFEFTIDVWVVDQMVMGPVWLSSNNERAGYGIEQPPLLPRSQGF
jgi:hypothetical protein